MFATQLRADARPELMNDRILSALQEYEYDPDQGYNFLRELHEEDSARFQSGAFAALLLGNTAAGHKEMMKLVRESGGDFLHKLIDLNLDLNDAIRGMTVLCRAEPGADVRLVRLLVHPKICEDPRVLSRVMDILDRLPTLPRMVPILMQVYRASSKQVRARITTMIGRGHRNEGWVEQRLSDPDSRVRANIVELYIGHSTPLAVDVFRRGIVDSAARVVANSALGMYYAASAPTLQFLGEQMAVSESANERAAAAWAMGQSRDLRFRAVLSRLMRDPDPMVRRQSIRGMAVLRKEEAFWEGEDASTAAMQPANNEEEARPRAVVRPTLQFRSPTGSVQYRLEIFRITAGEVGESARLTPLAGVRPIEVHTYENREPVLDYELHESAGKDCLGVYELVFQSRFAGREPQVTFQYRAHNGDYKPA
ncbi:hypothetical protein F183_A15240 [Bryobacterales bacterium F-183]|nr:hypothetical protein F183_A15240 [Bryobacterales bacterium F-183]